MRYLGIDYGGKRIGLAVSDPEGQIAFPYGSTSNLAEILRVLQEKNIGAIVVGLPRTFGRRESEQARSVRAFAAELGKAVHLPVAFEDEMLTTKLAERHTSREKADASAAALILQAYLDRMNVKVRNQNAK